MTTPPSSLPPPESAPLLSTPKKTRKATWLRLLATIPVGMEKPMVHMDPTTGKVDGPQRKKLWTYLGIIARDNVDVTFVNWKKVPTKAFDQRTKKIILKTVGKGWRQFKSDLTFKWALAQGKEEEDDTVYEKYGITKEKLIQFCQSRKDPSWEDPNTGELDKFGLYVDDNPSCLIALGKVYEGSTTVHKVPLGNDQVKVGLEEVRDADAHVPVPHSRGSISIAIP
ncbi:hypothetical protein GmHk_12G035195 [Glycine max]|nr:hypothetical protein GmHk_12G035195 [Glycine max]